MHLVYVHVAFHVSLCSKYAASGVRLLRAFAVVEPYPVIDDSLGLEAIIDFVQIDCLLLQQIARAADEDVV